MNAHTKIIAGEASTPQKQSLKLFFFELHKVYNKKKFLQQLLNYHSDVQLHDDYNIMVSTSRGWCLQIKNLEVFPLW